MRFRNVQDPRNITVYPPRFIPNPNDHCSIDDVSYHFSRIVICYIDTIDPTIKYISSYEISVNPDIAIIPFYSYTFTSGGNTKATNDTISITGT